MNTFTLLASTSHTQEHHRAPPAPPGMAGSTAPHGQGAQALQGRRGKQQAAPTLESWELKTLGSSVLPTMILCGCSLAGWEAPEPSERWDLEPWRSPDTRSLVVFPMAPQQPLPGTQQHSALAHGPGSKDSSKRAVSQMFFAGGDEQQP